MPSGAWPGPGDSVVQPAPREPTEEQPLTQELAQWDRWARPSPRACQVSPGSLLRDIVSESQAMGTQEAVRLAQRPLPRSAPLLPSPSQL